MYQNLRGAAKFITVNEYLRKVENHLLKFHFRKLEENQLLKFHFRKLEE